VLVATPSLIGLRVRAFDERAQAISVALAEKRRYPGERIRKVSGIHGRFAMAIICPHG